MKIDIYAILPEHGIKTMSDKGIRIMFDTQEPDADQFKDIFSMKGNFGRLLFLSEDDKTDIEELDVPDIKPDFRDEKTPSQRLRAVIYRYWEHLGSQDSFEVFYRSCMDSMIEKYKEKLQ